MAEATEPGRSNVNAGTMLSVLNHDAGFDAPSFVRQAIAWCKTAGTLPEAEEETLYSRLVNMRIERRHKMHASKEKNDLVEFYQVLNHKLGAYLYASKVGVQSPRIKYCGKAQDLPEDMSSQFGDKFVVKPLIGFSSKGVNIVVDGVDKFHGKSVNRDSLVKDFGPDADAIVEELIESAHPQFKGDVPPDYKFHVYEGRPEVMRMIDRNKEHHGMICQSSFDVSEDDWLPLGLDSVNPQCPPDEDGNVNGHYLDPGQKVAMTKAVRALASKLGPDWLRIDMFDSNRGPVLGEFTPYSSRGNTRDPVDSCIMSHLIVAHTVHGGPIDDVETVRAVGKNLRADLDFLTKSSNGAEAPNSFDWNQLGLTLEEVRRWSKYDEVEKCKVAKAAQEQLNDRLN